MLVCLSAELPVGGDLAVPPVTVAERQGFVNFMLFSAPRKKMENQGIGYRSLVIDH
jgi:hypothetical protein